MAPNPRILRRSAVALLCVGAQMVAALALAAGPVFVNTRYAKLRSGKTSSAPEVAKLAFGQQLTVASEEASFLQVTTADGKSGWIARQWVASTAPGKAGLAELLGAAARGGGGSGVAYTAGARGLAPEAESHAAGKGDLGQAIADVKEMERYSVPAPKVEAFLKDGRLGEFADQRTARTLRPHREPLACAVGGKPICFLRGIR
ncbi:MAG: SH3 domain-containing protein [Deltaproteobacteria bacterium]|nr:SH3 domain-containing protein [Deltaproteobacteria bacterium]